MIKKAIQKVIDKSSLSEKEMIETMNHIMEGKATDAQIASFITALRMKGETIEEITGAAKVMREKATKIFIEDGVTCLDVVGTGGDKAHTFNISTTTAIVLAAGGVTVAKHGNRSVSSSCGSADVLKELGVNIEASKVIVERCIRECNIGFLFAPSLHGAMKYAIGPRREIGVRTIFNCLGPLTNPAGADHQLVGVYDNSLVEPIANVLLNLGIHRAMVVHGDDGLDEITTTTKTYVAELSNKTIRTYYIDPKDYGLGYSKLTDLRGGDAKANADITISILSGEKGHKRNTVILNAGSAFYIVNLTKSIQEGIKKAEEVIDSGNALNTLNQLIKISNQN
ncbi:MAG: anthranilate phosphoribosyltransferase [Spirochaetota bacterium]|nr:anthranilate phosphoribosyltransferase [Spirochaetota bacterium]